MDLISVVIPVYKVEEYLEQCLDSVIHQTYTNLEIILVDDGSPDNCPEICNRYAEKDSRIIVIHKENGGLSDARNAGLKAASGEYFYFVDGDDTLPPDSIAWMMNCLAQHHADMVIAGFERFRENSGDVFFSTCPSGEETITVMNREEALRDFYRDGCQAWAVLYARHIHEGIFFPYGEINEDEAIVFHILERCKTVVVTDKVVYSYRNRDESITTSSFSPKKFAWYRHCRDNLAWIREHHPELTELAAARYRGAILWTLTEIALSDTSYPEEQQDLLKELQKEKKLFSAIPFGAVTEKIRYTMLAYLPFAVYRICIRRKRNV
ncbi:MAG: glycosyltransferase [Clostridia bacterium]|nr:glycosyltransferase [Clostridia bacterium]